MNNATELEGRILWHDGDSSFDLDALYEYILLGKQINGSVWVNNMSSEIRQFNELNPNTPLRIKDTLKEFNTEWVVPDKFKNIDVTKYILGKLLEELDKSDDFTQDEIQERIDRVNEELTLYEEYDLVDILKVVSYIVEEFEKNNVVWGTGRGSSCCSYCLYLIGLHDVDSILYGLELSEFFR